MGKRIAVSGGIGAGKSTVIKLIKIILNLMILILSFLPFFVERNPMGRMSSEDIISIFMTSFIWSI